VHRLVDRSGRPALRRAIGEVETAANNEADVRGLGRVVRPYDAGQRVAVDDGQSFDAEQGRLGEQSSQEDAPRRKLKCEVT
jgi:hypothetical protein